MYACVYIIQIIYKCIYYLFLFYCFLFIVYKHVIMRFTPLCLSHNVSHTHTHTERERESSMSIWLTSVPWCSCQHQMLTYLLSSGLRVCMCVCDIMWQKCVCVWERSCVFIFCKHELFHVFMLDNCVCALTHLSLFACVCLLMFPWWSLFCLCLTAEVSRPQAVTQTDDVTEPLCPQCAFFSLCLCLWMSSKIKAHGLFRICLSCAKMCIYLYLLICAWLALLTLCVCACVCSGLCLFALILNFSQPCVLLLLTSDTVTQLHAQT